MLLLKKLTREYVTISAVAAIWDREVNQSYNEAYAERQNVKKKDPGYIIE